MVAEVLQKLDTQKARSLEGLKHLLSIPSISAQPDHSPDMRRCADWIAGQLREMRLVASIEETGGHPIVLARNEHKDGRPTVLFYGHYDVQPPEPLDLWTSPAFVPTVRKTEAGTDAIYARGAVDDKGQVWCHIEAIRAWQHSGGIPVNIILLIEGEEEVGSKNLVTYLQNNAQKLKADIAVISDTGQLGRGMPAITYGLRGIVAAEVFIQGPSHDLHSGMYGGSVANPANILCQLMASLHDGKRRVNIPGFYDDVVRPTKAERDAWAKLPFSEEEYLRETGAPGLMGELKFTTLERRWVRPTLDINGLTSGYQGPGGKTIIPSTASAKVTMRLVPNMDPEKIGEAFEQAIRDRAPHGVRVEVARREGGGAPAVVVPRTGKPMQAAIKAVHAGFGVEPVLIREGGSIPVVAFIKSILGIDTLLVGFGLPDDRVHSPNEKFDLDALYSGTRTAAVLYHELARLK